MMGHCDDATPSSCDHLCSFLRCVTDCISCGSGEMCLYSPQKETPPNLFSKKPKTLASSFDATCGHMLAWEGLILAESWQQPSHTAHNVLNWKLYKKGEKLLYPQGEAGINESKT